MGTISKIFGVIFILGGIVDAWNGFIADPSLTFTPAGGEPIPFSLIYLGSSVIFFVIGILLIRRD